MLKNRTGTSTRDQRMSEGEFYNHCRQLFTKGQLREIDPWITAHIGWSDEFGRKLQKLCSDKCFTFATDVASFIRGSNGSQAPAVDRAARS